MAHLRWRSPSTFPADGSPSPHTRPFWPWLWFPVVAVLLLSLLWRVTAPPALPEPRPMSAGDANMIVSIVQFEMTAAARHAALATPERGAPLEVYVVGMATAEPTATQTPFARKPTVTPIKHCPADPGTRCQWPEPPPTPNVKPTATPLSVCSTPVPHEQCVMPSDAVLPSGNEASGSVDIGATACAALHETWC